MRVAFRKSDGMYCDSADSFAVYPGDDPFIRSNNVMGRLGGKPEDYVILDADPKDVPQPELRKLLDGKLVEDTDKIAAIHASKDEEAQDILRRDGLVAKFRDRTATLGEVCEFLSDR